jgi:NAD(P)-dependent dehydrogenase (short-subunit alcohol dehydrogenase family)
VGAFAYESDLHHRRLLHGCALHRATPECRIGGLNIVSESLKGRTVVVTGAASGIGKSMVELFLEAGAAVVGADVNDASLAALKEQFPAVETVAGDISKADDCDRIVAAAGDRLDVLNNNAGILDRLALIDELDDALWERVIAVNLTGTFMLTRRAVLKMKTHGGGVITNTSSTSANGGGRAGPAYSVSKAGVLSLTRNVAVTCAEFGIRCNAILPGSVDTNMAHSSGSAELQLSARGIALLGRLTGKPAPAHPHQIAHVAVFLASDEASRVSGAEIAVDGGVFAY